MRYIHAVVMVLGAVPYLVFFGWELLGIAPEDSGQAMVIVIVIWNALLLITSGLAIADGIVKVLRRRTRALATDVFVVKLAAVPFFLINFTIFAAVTPVALFMTGPFAVLGIGFVITLTYLAMLSTSIPGFAAVIALRRDRRISNSMTVVSVLLLLVFVLDIVAGILLFAADRKKPAADDEKPSRRARGVGVPGAFYVQAAVMLLGIATYLAVFYPTVLGLEASSSSSWPLVTVAWNAVLLVVAVLVTIDGLGKLRRRETRKLATGVLMVKLAAIPFFLTNFGVMAMVVQSSLEAPLLGLTGLAVAIALTYVAMLTTSISGFATVVALRRDRHINPPMVALFTVMLALFVTDVAAAILMFHIERRTRSMATTVATSIAPKTAASTIAARID